MWYLSYNGNNLCFRISPNKKRKRFQSRFNYTTCLIIFLLLLFLITLCLTFFRFTSWKKCSYTNIYVCFSNNKMRLINILKMVRWQVWYINNEYSLMSVFFVLFDNFILEKDFRVTCYFFRLVFLHITFVENILS